MGEMEEKTKVIVVDFPDQATGNVYGPRWYNTARILGLKVSVQASEFGLGKYHYKIMVRGNANKITEFIKFIENSLALSDLTITNIM